MATAGNEDSGDKWERLRGVSDDVRRYLAERLGRRAARRRQGTPSGPPSKRLRNLAVGLGVLVAAVLAWNWSEMRESARIGAAYGARVGCVCRFVSVRGIDQCEAELAAAPLTGMAARVSLSEDAEARTISAGVPFLASQSATYDPESGCRLEPWSGD